MAEDRFDSETDELLIFLKRAENGEFTRITKKPMSGKRVTARRLPDTKRYNYGIK